MGRGRVCTLLLLAILCQISSARRRRDPSRATIKRVEDSLGELSKTLDLMKEGGDSKSVESRFVGQEQQPNDAQDTSQPSPAVAELSRAAMELKDMTGSSVTQNGQVVSGAEAETARQEALKAIEEAKASASSDSHPPSDSEQETAPAQRFLRTGERGIDSRADREDLEDSSRSESSTRHHHSYQHLRKVLQGLIQGYSTDRFARVGHILRFVERVIRHPVGPGLAHMRFKGGDCKKLTDEEFSAIKTSIESTMEGLNEDPSEVASKITIEPKGSAKKGFLCGDMLKEMQQDHQCDPRLVQQLKSLLCRLEDVILKNVPSKI